MKKEVLAIFPLILLLLTPFSDAQLNSIEIISVKVNENAIQVLIDNKLGYDIIKETFIINNQYIIIQEVEFTNLEVKHFTVSYPSGIKLETLQVIIDDQTASYTFTGAEDNFVIDQAISQTSELTQVQESNSPISYIYSNQRLAKIQDNNIIYYHSDNIGSTSLQTNSLGDITTKNNYLPFGKELSFSLFGKEKYGFTSKEYDVESSLNYFNARYYNPSNGKFISNDPIFKPSEGGYAYVKNNPLIITDPSGKKVEIIGGNKESGEILAGLLSKNNRQLEDSKDTYTISFSDTPSYLLSDSNDPNGQKVLQPVSLDKNKAIVYNDPGINQKAAISYALNLLSLQEIGYEEIIIEDIMKNMPPGLDMSDPELNDIIKSATQSAAYSAFYLRAITETYRDYNEYKIKDLESLGINIHPTRARLEYKGRLDQFYDQQFVKNMKRLDSYMGTITDEKQKSMISDLFGTLLHKHESYAGAQVYDPDPYDDEPPEIK